MSTKIRGLPPRVAIRIKDSATGSYPSVKRAGDDSRTGAYSVLYNDKNTINFIEVEGDSSSSIKRPAPFDLTVNQGFYNGSSNLIAYYNFNNWTSDGDTSSYFVQDLGNSELFHMTSSYGSDQNPPSLFSSDVPSSGSLSSVSFGGSGIFNDQYFAIEGSQALELATSSFAFGNGTTDYPRSISCWLKKDFPNTVTGSVFFAMSGSDIGKDDAFHFGMYGTGEIVPGKIYASLHDNSSDRKCVSTIDPFGEKLIHLGEWFHFAWTYDGSGNHSGMSFYINGEKTQEFLGDTDVGYVAVETVGTEIVLGAATTSGSTDAGKPWRGHIDNFALFDRVLGEYEIKELAGYRKGISLPTGLDSNSTFLEKEQMTDIFVTGTPRKGVIDNFISFTPGENITPFNETFRPEQSQYNSFFQSGSKKSEVGLGFSSKLASKTQIRFSLNVDSLTTMNATTASMVYYNNNTKTFDLAGGSEALTDPGAISRNGNLGRDSKLFNSIGLPIISGTDGALNKPSPYHGENLGTNIDSALSFQQLGSLTTNDKFLATNSQIISMENIINFPFLLEKAVIELNVSSSVGWFNDFTISQVTAGGSDLGGPCVTVCLMNQIADYKRELILSATIIPNGDTGSFAYKGLSSLKMPAGFGSFATPGAVVNDMGIQKVSLQCKTSISNGIILPARAANSFEDSDVGEVASFGRSLDPKDPSGRSFFGKEFSAAKKTDSHIRYSIEDLDNTTTAQKGVFYQYIKEENSPYLLYPTDNLILGISKHRPAIYNISDFTSGLTGSHEFGIAPGVINITLYGSMVRDGKEFHDTLNQNLTSNAIHEIVGAEPVLDQFDVESRSSFTGSYIAEFFTGSIFNSDIGKKRKLRASLIGTSNTLIDTYDVYTELTDFRVARNGFNKFVQIKSDNERYYDTLIPRLDQMLKIEEKSVLGLVLNDTKYNSYPLGREINDDGAFEPFENWDFIFPFEAKYSSVSRNVSILKNSTSTTGSIHTTENSFIIRANIIGNKSIVPVDWWYAGFRIGDDSIIGGSGSLVPLKEDIFKKNAFGFGDSQYGQPTLLSKVVDYPLIFSFDCKIRGFKYGLLNANKEVKKYHFRRDRYGQLRDMIEQAKDSKIFLESDSSIVSSPVRVRFISNGNFTNGEETFSNNVSFEATSSLPYFDGLARSRGELPDTEIVP